MQSNTPGESGDKTDISLAEPPFESTASVSLRIRETSRCHCDSETLLSLTSCFGMTGADKSVIVADLLGTDRTPARISG